MLARYQRLLGGASSTSEADDDMEDESTEAETEE